MEAPEVTALWDQSRYFAALLSSESIPNLSVDQGTCNEIFLNMVSTGPFHGAAETCHFKFPKATAG